MASQASFVLRRPPERYSLHELRVVPCHPMKDNIAMSYTSTPFTLEECLVRCLRGEVSDFLRGAFLAALAFRFTRTGDEPAIVYPRQCKESGCEGEMEHVVRLGKPKDDDSEAVLATRLRLVIRCALCKCRIVHCYVMPVESILDDEAILDGLMQRASLDLALHKVSRIMNKHCSLVYRGIRRTPLYPYRPAGMLAARMSLSSSAAKQEILGQSHAPTPVRECRGPHPSFKKYRPERPAADNWLYRFSYTVFIDGRIHRGSWMWDEGGNPLDNGPEIDVQPGPFRRAAVDLLSSLSPWSCEGWWQGVIFERYDAFEQCWLPWPREAAIALDPEFEVVVVFRVDHSDSTWPDLQGATAYDYFMELAAKRLAQEPDFPITPPSISIEL
ncbi:hypothetical protein CYLTODRAFT_459485 [Cylindrobasidium torrendii FP15055 ss-10]|uniref:Uncharacterized protein n=1 Tax=Cylindrobasidium torrendii FP15055 ss-10 TaxID=1314674 RepID=A0A0D7AX67_9AGAR|nr:hypothetical protein CYLTODRAFT_459485 [Cylindrobasidium torrendii FP15055 ss-10]